MNTLDLLTEISGSKLSKRTDAQLAHQEKLNIYYKSEKNMEHLTALGIRKQKYTMEQIQRIRVMFWEEGKSVVECSNYIGAGLSFCIVKKYLTNKLYVDPNFKWDTSEYPKLSKKQRLVNRSSLKQIHLDLLNGMDVKTWQTKWNKKKTAYIYTRHKLKQKGYELPPLPRK